MKKLIFLLSPCLMLSMVKTVEAKRIVLDIPDEEIAIVETYVVDAEEWLRQAWANKVAGRTEAIIKDEVDHRLKKEMTVPASKQEILSEGKKRLGTRKKRDEEAEKRRQQEIEEDKLRTRGK